MSLNDVKSATMCCGNIVTHSQPQTGATFLGAEKWLEDIFPAFLGYAGTAVLEENFHTVSYRTGTDAQLTTLRHRIQRVQDQIKKICCSWLLTA